MPRKTRKTPETQQALIEIIEKEFGGLQSALVRATGLDQAAIFRVVTGSLPATPDFVGRIVAKVPNDLKLRLMTAFLTDLSRTTAPGFSVHVSRKETQP